MFELFLIRRKIFYIKLKSLYRFLFGFVLFSFFGDKEQLGNTFECKNSAYKSTRKTIISDHVIITRLLVGKI